MISGDTILGNTAHVERSRVSALAFLNYLEGQRIRCGWPRPRGLWCASVAEESAVVPAVASRSPLSGAGSDLGVSR